MQHLTKKYQNGHLKKKVFCRLIEYMVVSKRGSTKCDLHIGNVNNKQVREFRYVDCVLIDDGKWHIKNQMCIGIAKCTFRKPCKILDSRKII